jgi:hypothetical protein
VRSHLPLRGHSRTLAQTTFRLAAIDGDAPLPETAAVTTSGEIGVNPFRTLHAVFRDWSQFRRICELQNLPWSGSSEEEGERFTRLWVSADRKIREEFDTGQVRYPRELEETNNWPLLETAWLATSRDRAYLGEREVGDRRGVAFGAQRPAGFLLPGADRCVGIFDSDRAVLLRAEAWLGDELLMIEEIVQVRFDEVLDASLFAAA